MKSASLHPYENDRLAELLRLEVLDSEDENCFDELTELASTICGTPISLISLVDSNRQWFKSRQGLDATETSRDLAFCAHAILQEQIFEVPNALEDSRFADNPLVTGSPEIRFYAGKPLTTSSGMPIGTLCVIDKEPKRLSNDQKTALDILAKQVISQLELRLQTRKILRMNKEREQFYAVLAHDLKSPFNGVIGLSQLLLDQSQKNQSETVTLYAREILNSSFKIYEILDELLQWSEHALSGHLPALSAFSIIECITNSQELLSEPIKAKHLDIELDVANSIQAMGNATLFKTAIRNLLSNAIKYSPINGTISITAQQLADKVRVSIRDQGKGIPENIKVQLFKESVCSSAGSLGEPGHGLGLHLTNELILKQAGKIWLDSNITKGTLIHCELPSPK